MNPIFHKVPEPEQTDLTEKQDQDKQFIHLVARELGVEGLEVQSIARIGRINESGEHFKGRSKQSDCQKASFIKGKTPSPNKRSKA